MRCAARFVVPALAALLLLAAPLGTARGGDPAPAVDEPAFLDALKQAKGLLADGRGTAGLELVKKTLELHQEKDYVRAKRSDLEDLVRRLAFRTECPPPEPKSLVKGELRRYIPMTGDIEIHYRAGAPTDFETHDRNLVFPARFRGPFTVTIKGDSYPALVEEVPVVEVGMEKDPKTGRVQGWAVAFGIAPYVQGSQKVWVPPRILAVDGEKKTEVATSKLEPARPRRPYRLDVQVTSGRVAALIDGAPLGSAPKPDGVFGYAILKVSGWSEIVIAGRAEPSWIQTKVDAIVDGKRGAFEKGYDVHRYLPDWLYAKAPAVQRLPGTSEIPPALKGLSPELLAEHLVATALILAGDYKGALDAAEAMKAKGAPEGVTALLAAQALVGLEEPGRALVEVDKALAATPGEMTAVLLKAGILRRLGRLEDLAATLKVVTDSPTAGADAFETACFLLLLGGRLEEARAVAETAARRGLRTPGLETLGRVLVTAQNGPAWPKTYEYKSTNYRIVSDIDPDTCRRSALLLEDALVDFRINVRSLRDEPKRLYTVYLFSGRAGFQRYLADSTIRGGRAPENVAGLYSPILKQLLIWNLPTRDEMMKTIRHEGFHQYLDRLLPDPPVWLNEGLAVYLEVVPKPGAELHLERPRPDYLDILKGMRLVPLKDFVRITPAAFYAEGLKSYAEAWLFVHMMRHGTTKHRDYFRSLLQRLETSAGPDAVHAVFDDAALTALDADLKLYLASMTKPR